MLELDHQLSFDPSTAPDFFAELPAQPGVCAIEPRASTAQPFLIRTQNLQRRLSRLLGPDDPTSKRLNLREFAGGVRFRVTGSRFEQAFAFYQNAKQLHPGKYRQLLRMRPPAVLKVSLKNAYPRCFVTRRIPTNAEGQPIAGAYYGPFRKRKVAERFAESVLDFFKVRRCQIKIRRDPTFPGCLYSEMKMCLAPCFAGCSQEEYAGEVQRLVQFLDTGGDSLRASLEKEREAASEELDFERASALHKRLDKIDDALRGSPELARNVTEIDAVILQRGAEEQTIGAYAVRGGYIAEPLFIRFAELASAPKSVEQLFRDYLEAPSANASREEGTMYRAPTGAPNEASDAQRALAAGAGHAADVSAHVPRRATELSEHLWLLARWFYDTKREGEIFFRHEAGRPAASAAWPYRRILRACPRLLAPPAPDTAPDATPQDAAPAAPQISTQTAPRTTVETTPDEAARASALPHATAKAPRSRTKSKAPAPPQSTETTLEQGTLFEDSPAKGAK